MQRLGDSLGINKLATFYVLLGSALVFFLFSLLVFRKTSLKEQKGLTLRVQTHVRFQQIALGLTALLLVVGMILGLVFFHDSLSYPLVLWASMIGFGIFSSAIPFLSPEFASRYRYWGLCASMIFIFALSGRMINNGIDAQETTVDTYNIFVNGFYPYSLHNPIYNLAPIDSILKVIFLKMVGLNAPYDPYSSSFIFAASGMAALFALCALAKALKREEFFWLVSAIMVITPYSVGTMLNTPPTSIVGPIIVITAVAVTLPFILQAGASARMLAAVSLLALVAILGHPESFVLVLYPMTLVLLSKLQDYPSQFSPRFGSNIRFIYSFCLMVALIFLPKLVFAGALTPVYGVISQALRDMIRSLLLNLEPINSGSSIAYGSVPKFAIYSYTALVGVSAAIAIIELAARMRGGRPQFGTYFILNFAFFVGWAGVSLFTLLGGHSLSRYSIGPYSLIISVPLLVYLGLRLDLSTRKRRIALAGLMALLVSGTLSSPFVFPDQYAIQQANKGTNVYDYEYLSVVAAHLPKNYVINTFSLATPPEISIYQTTQAPSTITPMTLGDAWGVLFSQYYLIPHVLSQSAFLSKPSGNPISIVGPTSQEHLSKMEVVFVGWQYAVTFG